MTQWKKLLKSLGFTESEATVYLVSLEMGPASVQELAKKANVSRVTTYTVIEALMRDGLMSTVQKGKKNYFVAEAPERLVSFVQGKVKGMESTLGEVSAALHELKLVQRGEKPVVKMFEGDEALLAIQNDILLTRPKEVDEFGNMDDLRKANNAVRMEEHDTKLSRLRYKSRMSLLTKGEKPTSFNPEAEIFHISDVDHDFHGDVLVYANKVALSTFGLKQISVLIESQDLADTLRVMMHLARKGLKK